MPKGEVNEFGGFGSKGSSTGSSGGRSSLELESLDEWAVSFILDAVDYLGGDYTIPVSDADANEIPDEKREAYDIPDDVEYVSAQSFFPVEFDSGCVGTQKKVTREQLQASVDAGYVTEEEIEEMEFDEKGRVAWKPEGSESGPQSYMNDILNGYHSDAIVETFGSGSKVRVSAPAISGDVVEAAHERFTLVRFMVSDSSQAALSRKRSQVSVGELTQSELEEWADENGFADKV